MINLIDYICASELSSLSAWTSMHDLCISQTPVTYPDTGPYLRVSPLANDQLEFRYVDTPEKHKQWCRIVSFEDAVPRLDGFVRQLHWSTARPE